MDTIGSRLKRVRGKLSGEQFAALFGLNAQTIYRYERGARKPGTDFLQMVANKTGANLEWLIAGEGEPDLSPLEISPESLPSISRSAEPLNKHEPCPQCAKLESRLEKMEERLEILEQERREVSTENRQLHRENAALLRENGELREKLALLEHSPNRQFKGNDNEGDFPTLFDENRSTTSSSRMGSSVHK